ncbi:hypothetical protein, conserved [Plasmodium gonderi]|uniref:Uncharacterized protein n=1 Tax=Plasmodium gonderi TaxID=77519 RepID=A0A1Y1JHI5_PLAGO|nr:hypothetical protein, conserved [Plasmodium gonderi]GAW81700.1 hypothetical protein, conserved [Plasmodium gonderi]
MNQRRKMDRRKDKKYITVYYYSNDRSNKGKNDRKKKEEIKMGYVTIEITRMKHRIYPHSKINKEFIFQKGKNISGGKISGIHFLKDNSQNIKHGGIGTYKCRDKTRGFIANFINSFWNKNIKGYWTYILFDVIFATKKRINEKINYFYKEFVLNNDYFYSELKINNKTVNMDKVNAALNSFNVERAKMFLESACVYDNIINIGITSKGNTTTFPQYLGLNNSSFEYSNLNGMYKNTSTTDNYYAQNMINFNGFNNLFFNQNFFSQSNFSHFNCRDDSCLHQKFGNINFHTDLTPTIKQNVKHFYISLVNKKTNVKELRKISLMEISNFPSFFLCQGFLSEVESYLALNHCLLYVKKNQAEMSQIHLNLFSILIDVDEVNFLEERISKSILRHIINRLTTLFKISTDDIQSVHFCIYIKNNQEMETLNFVEKNIYKYSIFIFLSSKNGNFIEFPYNGLKIMVMIGNCMIYECTGRNKCNGGENMSNSNTFKFELSEEKLFFLKINLKENVDLHHVVVSETDTTEKGIEQFSNDAKLTGLPKTVASNISYSSNNSINNNVNDRTVEGLNPKANSFSSLQKNVDKINKEIVDLNMNIMKYLYLRTTNSKNCEILPVVFDSQSGKGRNCSQKR